MADPEEYRSKDQVAEWRLRDPIITFGDRLVAEKLLTPDERDQMDADAITQVDAAVAFAEESPAPAPEALYDDVYVIDREVRGWWSVDERQPEPHRGEDEREYEQPTHTGDAPNPEHPTADAQKAAAKTGWRED